MLDLVLIALLQAVAGDPAQTTPPAPATVEQPSAGEAPAVEAPAAEAPATDAPPAEQQFREERVCERLQVSTGERMPRRRCRTVLVPVETPAPAPQ
jgi:hypothetical protein